MNTAFERSNFTLESLARNERPIQYKVRGFWSGSTITIYTSFGYKDCTPNFTISTSSGGREDRPAKPDYVHEDYEAYANYAEALADAAQLVKRLMTENDMLNEIIRLRKEFIEELRLKSIEEAERKAEILKKNPQATPEQIKKALTAWTKLAKKGESVIKLIQSCGEGTGKYELVVSYNENIGKVKYLLNDRPLTRNSLYATLTYMANAKSVEI